MESIWNLLFLDEVVVVYPVLLSPCPEKQNIWNFTEILNCVLGSASPKNHMQKGQFLSFPVLLTALWFKL